MRRDQNDSSGFLIEDQAEIVAFLSDPRSYPDGLTANGPIKLIQTHASTLFLVGDLVFKLKRAVRFSFLDYSTCKKREIACRNEIRLNRRTAADLYLGVRPIRKGRDSLVMGDLDEADGADVIDWLVVMRRFDEATRFDRLASDGLLSEQLLDRLTRVVAAFHDRQPETAVPGDLTGAGAMLSVLSINFGELRVSDWFLAEDIDALERRYGEATALLEPLLDERARAGAVRSCHGDLHLRNICLTEGEPTLFDCVEYEPAFSETDTLYDLAFLLMDLLIQGPAGSANLVLSRYMEACPKEISGLSAIPLFIGLRAQIRVYVLASGSALQPPSKGRQEAREEASLYFRLSMRALEQVKPFLLAIGGLSGSGKSTLARALAPGIGGIAGALVLRTDAIRKEFWGADPLEPLPPAAYTPAVSKAVYATMEERARSAILAGCPVILDATFIHPESRARVEDLVRDLAVPFRGLWLNAPRETLASRIEGRRCDVSDATVPVMENQLSGDCGEITWPRIDAVDGVEAVAEKARVLLSNIWDN